MLSSTTELREKLIDNTRYFREKIGEIGYDVLEGETAIVPVMLYDAKLANDVADAMLEEGIYVIGFSYPVVPKGKARIRVQVSGRLGGAEMSRTEFYREGRVPLHTLRADIDYGLAEARTTYGVIGVKVWIFKGEVFEKPEAQQAEAPEAAAGARS